MPESQVSDSFEYPTLTNLLIFDWPTCVRNRLSAFQVVQGFSAPAGRFSTALMLRCTLASRSSSRSLRNSMRAAFAVVLMGSVNLMKLFRDFRCGTTPRCLLSGCLCLVCRVRSVRLATDLLTQNKPSRTKQTSNYKLKLLSVCLTWISLVVPIRGFIEIKFTIQENAIVKD